MAKKEIKDVARYVQVLAYNASSNTRSDRGKEIFEESCSACHGMDGSGNQDLGAPPLNNQVWLYGGDRRTLIETISNGRQAHMPSFNNILDEQTIKKLVVYVRSLSDIEKKEVINNALEAGPTIPFPNFSKLFKTWLKILTTLSEEQRAGLFSAYITEIAQNPQKLITFNLDGILEIYLTLDDSEKETIANTVKRIINRKNKINYDKIKSEEKIKLEDFIPPSMLGHFIPILHLHVLHQIQIPRAQILSTNSLNQTQAKHPYSCEIKICYCKVTE